MVFTGLRKEYGGPFSQGEAHKYAYSIMVDKKPFVDVQVQKDKRKIEGNECEECEY